MDTIPDEINYLLQKLNKALNRIVNHIYIGITQKELEGFLYYFEKIRREIYDYIRIDNEIAEGSEIHCINNEYKANLQNNVLSIYIPEKLPNLKNKSSYVNSQIIINVAEVTKHYKALFYDKFMIVVVKIYDTRKVWDVDNRTVKPIQDGLIYGEVIRDDNLFNCCYMVQGFYSESPHVEVSVLEADEILKFIDNKLPNINK